MTKALLVLPLPAPGWRHQYVVVGSDLFFRCIFEVLHAWTHLLQVDIAEPPIEQDLTGEETEFQAQLLIVNRCIASEIEKGIIEIGQCFFKIA